MGQRVVAQEPFGLEGEKKPSPVYLVLISTARQLTCEDLLELVEMTEKHGARVHITLESWQIVVEVADGYDQRVREAIWHLGHYCVRFLGRTDHIHAFLLTEDENKRKTLSTVMADGERRRLRCARESGLRPNV